MDLTCSPKTRPGAAHGTIETMTVALGGRVHDERLSFGQAPVLTCRDFTGSWVCSAAIRCQAPMHKVVQRTDDLAASLLDLNRSHLLPNTPGSRPANAVLFMHVIAGTAPARRSQAEHHPRLPGRRQVDGLTPSDQLAPVRAHGWRLVSRAVGAVWCCQKRTDRDGER